MKVTCISRTTVNNILMQFDNIKIINTILTTKTIIITSS